MKDTATNWSTEQRRIFDEFENPDGHVVIEALAGTGKTTTIVEGGKYAPERTKKYCAFNKRIEQELNVRLNQVPGASSQTLHATGFRSVKLFKENTYLCKDYSRADTLTNHACGDRAPDAIRRLVTTLHTKGREIAPHAKVKGELTDLAWQFDCVPDAQWETAGFGVDYIEESALKAMEYAAQPESFIRTGIDFSDMIFLPVRNRWMVQSEDLVLVDETQDMTVAQLELAQGICKGRLIIVGDRNQAIYGFRGADSDGMDRLTRELSAKVLHLNTTYRCGKAIVELAQQFVPEFTAGPNNPEGEISSLSLEKLVGAAEGGDFILSRINAPLVGLCFSMIRSGKRARIAGRDIGQGLKTIIRKLKAKSIPDFMLKLENWESKQVLRFLAAKKEAQVKLVRDQAETLLALAADAKGVGELEQRIDLLFTDEGLGQDNIVTCSSVHRSKGLEANRVFILRDTLRDDTQEERNIQYVAITRAKRQLVWVYGR